MSGAPAAPSAGLVAICGMLLAARGDQDICLLVLPDGSDVPRRLAGQIGVDRVFVHPPTPPPWRGGDIPVTLGAHDQDIAAPRAVLWPGSLLPSRSRLRRIDTWYGRRRIGVLVLGDPATALAVLRGAAALVREQRPPVLLDLRGADPSEGRRIADAVLAELPGYRWADGTGATTPLALPEGGAVPDLRGLAAPDRRVISVPFDHALAGGGLHAPEPDAPLGGRWTGAGIAVWFLLPRPDPGRWTLRLDIADWGNAASGFGAEIDDRAVAPSAVTAEAIAYGPFELDRPCGGVLRVTLFPPRAARDMQRGPRLIGLRILRATLLRGG